MSNARQVVSVDFRKKVPLNSPPIIYVFNFEFMKPGMTFLLSVTLECTALQPCFYIPNNCLDNCQILRYYYIRLTIRFIHFDFNIDLNYNNKLFNT